MNMNESTHYDLVVIAAGLLVVLGGLVSLRTGKTLQRAWSSYGAGEDCEVNRQNSPIQFWVHVALYFAIGGALVAYGVNQLLMR